MVHVLPEMNIAVNRKSSFVKPVVKGHNDHLPNNQSVRIGIREDNQKCRKWSFCPLAVCGNVRNNWVILRNMKTTNVRREKLAVKVILTDI
ncbi:MAG: hypothetical protein IJT43_07695 [Stomatobaculum sp.]|nr:hypothetical protein [Stomatobaculum sp.]